MTEFTRLFAARYADVVADGVPEWHGTVIINNTPSATPTPPPLELRHGLQVVPQHQHNLYTVHLHTPLGFISANDLAALGALATTFSTEHALRATITQNLLMRSVKETDLPALADALTKLEADLISPQALQCFTACAGAATCRLGICLTPGRPRLRRPLDTSNLSPAAPSPTLISTAAQTPAVSNQSLPSVFVSPPCPTSSTRYRHLGGRCDKRARLEKTSANSCSYATLPGDLVPTSTPTHQGEKFPDY